jgi:general secretion pathway protein H
MPTSAPGSKPGHGRHRGFTLIELLVVVALIAIASATLALALRDPAQSQLEQDAERLSLLLETARAEARASGLDVRWQPLPSSSSGEQFRFSGLPPSLKLPQRWLHEAPGVSIEGGRAELQLGPEPLLPAQALRLQRGEHSLRLASDGLRPFEVVRE